MAKIFYPIDGSNLNEIIPLGQDIIYSTLCKGYAKDPYTEKNYNWRSHVLMTNEGIAFSIPLSVNYTKKELKKIPNPEVNHFIPWGNVMIAKYQGLVSIKGGFTVQWIYDKIRYRSQFYIERDNKYESRESFKHRQQDFIDQFLPVVTKKRNELADELYKILKTDPSLQKSKEFYKNKDYYRFDYVLHREVSRKIKKEIKEQKKSKKE
ncbi:MAG: hypothetical protein ACFFDF_03290 [Candidatus Odinarchaeota archaeon]